MKQNIYAGAMVTPSDNFQMVRDNRRTMPFWMDIDLSTLRNESNALLINASGNSFYIDANPNDGIALVEFQDTGSDASSVRLYCSPGTIFNLPFTQFKVTNAVQTGKKIRIVYGTDVDFQPGSVTQISVAGTFAVRPEAPTGFFNDNSALTANTPIQIFAPASNVNGCVLLAAYGMAVVSGAGLAQAFIAHTAAPANIYTGEVLAFSLNNNTGTTGLPNIVMPTPQYIAPGKGLYFISDTATPAGTGAGTTDYRSCRYKLL